MKRTEVYCAVHRPILDLLKGIATQKPKPVTVSQEDCKQVYFLKNIVMFQVIFIYLLIWIIQKNRNNIQLCQNFENQGIPPPGRKRMSRIDGYGYG